MAASQVSIPAAPRDAPRETIPDVRQRISGHSPYEPVFGFSRDLIGEALAKAGTSLDHVVRTRIYLTAAQYWEEVARAHGETFADIRPVTSAVIVAGLLDPAWLVEIEAEAQL
jgi:hypothetical protein